MDYYKILNLYYYLSTYDIKTYLLIRINRNIYNNFNNYYNFDLNNIRNKRNNFYD